MKSDNAYEYYLSLNKSNTIGGSWKTYTPGTPFTITLSAGEYKYIHVKPVADINGRTNEGKVSEIYNSEAPPPPPDTTPPTIIFDPYEGPGEGNTYDVTVNVFDYESGVDSNSLKYLWSESEMQPQVWEFQEPFANGTKISKKWNVKSYWYLWVLAKDMAGNTSIQRSGAFLFGPGVINMM